MSDDAATRLQILRDLDEIRELAAHVKTPAQFDAMVATILDPAMRKQIRALLAPLLLFDLPEAHAEEDE